MLLWIFFIDNNDRNNGNWGLLIDMTTGERQLAPVYDNGNAFSNKATDETLAALSEDSMVGGRTIYVLDQHLLSAKKFLKLDIEELKKVNCTTCTLNTAKDARYI